MATTRVLAILLAITTYEVQSTGFGLNLFPSGGISLKKGGGIGFKIETPGLFGTKKKSFEFGVKGNVQGSIGSKSGHTEYENGAVSGQGQNYLEHNSGDETNVNSYKNNNEYERRYTGAGVDFQKHGELTATSGGFGLGVTGEKHFSVSGGTGTYRTSETVVGQTQGSVEATKQHTPGNGHGIDSQHTKRYEVHYNSQDNIGPQTERDVVMINGNGPTISVSDGAGVTVHKEGILEGGLGGFKVSGKGEKHFSIGGGSWTHGTSGTVVGQTQGSVEATKQHTLGNGHGIDSQQTTRYEVHYNGQENNGPQTERDLVMINGNGPTSSVSDGAGVTVHKEGILEGDLGGFKVSGMGEKHFSIGGGSWTHGTSGTVVGQTQGSVEATKQHTPGNGHGIDSQHSTRYEVHYNGQENNGPQTERDVGMINGNGPTISVSDGAGVTVHKEGILEGGLGGFKVSGKGEKHFSIGGGSWTHGTSGTVVGQTQGSVETTKQHTPGNGHGIDSQHSTRYEVHYNGQENNGPQTERDVGMINGNGPTISVSDGAGLTVHKEGILEGGLGGFKVSGKGEKHFSIGGGSWTHGTSGTVVGQTQGSVETTKQHTPGNGHGIDSQHSTRYEVHYNGQENNGPQTERDVGMINGNGPTISVSDGAGLTVHKEGILEGGLGGFKVSGKGEKHFSIGGGSWTHGTSGTVVGQTQGSVETTKQHTPGNGHGIDSQHSTRYEVHYNGQENNGPQTERDVGMINGNGPTISVSDGAGLTVHKEGILEGGLGGFKVSGKGEKHFSIGGGSWTHGTSGTVVGQTQGSVETTKQHTPGNGHGIDSQHSTRYEVHYNGQENNGPQTERDVGMINGNGPTISVSDGAGVTLHKEGILEGGLGGFKVSGKGEKHFSIGGGSWTHGTSGTVVGQTQGSVEATKQHTPGNGHGIDSQHSTRYEVNYNGQENIGPQTERDLVMINGNGPTISVSDGAGVTVHKEGILEGGLGGFKVSGKGEKHFSIGGGSWTHGTSGTVVGQTQGSVEATKQHTPGNGHGIDSQHTKRYEVHYNSQDNIGPQTERDVGMINGNGPTISVSDGAGLTVHKEGIREGGLGGFKVSGKGEKNFSIGGGSWAHGTSGTVVGQTQGSVEATKQHTLGNGHGIDSQQTTRYEVHYNGQENNGPQTERDLVMINGNGPTSSVSDGAGVTVHKEGILEGDLGGFKVSGMGEKHFSIGGGSWTHGTSGTVVGQTQGSVEATKQHTPGNGHGIDSQHSTRYEVHYNGQENNGPQTERDVGMINGNGPTISVSDGAGVTVHKEGILEGGLGGFKVSGKGEKHFSIGGGSWTHGTSGTVVGQTQGSVETTKQHTPGNGHGIDSQHSTRYEVHYNGQENNGPQTERDVGMINGNGPTISVSDGAGLTVHKEGILERGLGGFKVSGKGEKHFSIGGGSWTHGTSGTVVGQTQGSVETTKQHTPGNGHGIDSQHSTRYEVHYNGQENNGPQTERDVGMINGNGPTISVSDGAGLTVHKEGILEGGLGGFKVSGKGEKHFSIGGGSWTHGTSGTVVGQTQGSVETTKQHTPGNGHGIDSQHSTRYEVHYNGQENNGPQTERDVGMINGNGPTISVSDGAGVTLHKEGILEGGLGGFKVSGKGEKHFSIGGGSWTHGTSGTVVGQTQGSVEATKQHTPGNGHGIDSQHSTRYEVNYNGQENIGPQTERDLVMINGNGPTISVSDGAGVTVHKEGILEGGLGGFKVSGKGEKHFSIGGGSWTHGTSGTVVGQTQGSVEATKQHTPGNGHGIDSQHSTRYEVHYNGQENNGPQTERDVGMIDGNGPTISVSDGAGVTVHKEGILEGGLGGFKVSGKGEKHFSIGGGSWTHGTSGTVVGQTQGSVEATKQHTPGNGHGIDSQHTTRYEVHYNGQENIGPQTERDLVMINGNGPTISVSDGAGVTVHKEGILEGGLGGFKVSGKGEKHFSIGGGSWTHGTSGTVVGQTQGSVEATKQHTPGNGHGIDSQHSTRYEVHYNGQENNGPQTERDVGMIDGNGPTISVSDGAGVTVHKEGILEGGLGGFKVSGKGEKHFSIGGGSWTHGTSGTVVGQTQGSVEATKQHTPGNGHGIDSQHTTRYEVHYNGQENIGPQTERDLVMINGNGPTISVSDGAGVTVHKEGILEGGLGGFKVSGKGEKHFSIGGGSWTHGTSGTVVGQTQGSVEATKQHTPGNGHGIDSQHSTRYEVHYNGQENNGPQTERDVGMIDGNGPTISVSDGAGVTVHKEGILEGGLGGFKVSGKGEKHFSIGGGSWTHGTSGTVVGQTQGSVEATKQHTPGNGHGIDSQHTTRYEVHYNGQENIGPQTERDLVMINGNGPTISVSDGAGVTVHKEGILEGGLGGFKVSGKGEKHFSIGGSTWTHGSSGIRVGQIQGSGEALVRQNLEYGQDRIVNGNKNKFELGYSRFGNFPTQTEHNMGGPIIKGLTSSGGSGAGTSLANDDKVIWGIGDHGININDKILVSSTENKNDQISGVEVQHSGFGQIQKHDHGRIEVGTGGDIERSFEATIYRNENGHTGCVNGHHQGQIQDHSRYHGNIGYGIGSQTTNNGYRQILNQGKINSEQEHGYTKHITLSSGDQNKNQRVRPGQDAAHHGSSFEFHSEKPGGVGFHQGEHKQGYSVVYVEHKGQDGSGARVWREGDRTTGSNVEIEGKYIGHLETQNHGESHPGHNLLNFLNKPGVVVYEQSTNTDNLISGQGLFNGRPSLSGTDSTQGSLNWGIEPSKLINHGSNGELHHFSEHRYGYHRGNKNEHQSKSEVKHFSSSATGSGRGGFSLEPSVSHTTSTDDRSALQPQSYPSGNSLHGQSSVETSGAGLLDIRMKV